MAYENYGDKLKYAAREAIANQAVEKSEPYRDELVKLSDETHESAYKVTYEIAEVALPPKIADEVERQLRISTNRLKSANGRNLDVATVQVIKATTNTLVDVVSGDKNFDEASRALATQAGGTVKTIVIERGKQVALNEAQRIGTELAGQTAQKIVRQVGGKNNPVLNAMAVGGIVKDLALDWADGKISDEQFVKLVTRRCTVLALKALASRIDGGVFTSAAIDYACNELFALMDAAELQAAADRRRVVAKIKTDALAEMNRQRGLMQKYFADEKLRWDKNVQAGFELIASGTYSNDVEVIAQGLDKILQNFGGQVAFDNREDFRRDFRQRKIVLNL